MSLGSEGRYISMDKGPNADNEPNITAVHNRRDRDNCSEGWLSFSKLFMIGPSLPFYNEMILKQLQFFDQP
ncbi:hypothetical protein D3C72_1305230 [compost metagenome]